MSIFDQSNQNVGAQFNAAGDIIISNVNIEDRKKTQSSSQIVFNLPNLKEAVYDRDSEAVELLQAISGEIGFEEQFWLLVAPSGFGKTFLITKALKEVTDGNIIKPEYQDKVQRILRIDCRATNSLAEIVSDFSEIIETRLKYNLRKGETAQNWLNKYLFPEIQKTGKVWLILENFETWLNSDNSIIKPEIQSFLNAILEGNHSLRVLFVSQVPPNSDIRKKLRELKTVGEELYKGLPETEALDYLRNEGKEVGLAQADEKLLKEFLGRVAYIPQAMSSLIGYLQSIEGYSFEEFMADDDLWQGFDEYESETDDGDLAKRRTKALIAKQIQAQSDEVKFLLSVLAFIEKSTLREVLELFFKTHTQATQAISRLTSHRLATVRVNSRGFRYYELHTYFLEQSKKHLLINIENWFLHNGFAYSDRAFKKGYELHLHQQYDLSLELSEFVEKIIRLLGGKSGGLEIAFALGATLLNKSDSLRNLSEYKEGFKNIIEAIEIFRDLRNHYENDDLRIKLAMALYTYGVLLTVTNQSDEAINVFEESVVILKNFIKQGKKELRIELTMSLMAMAGALSDLNKSSAVIDKHSQDSISNYDEAILILRQLIKREKIPEARENLLKNLAMGLLNKGFSLVKFKKLSEANSSCSEAINILLKLLENNHKNAELLNCLAVAYRNKALALEGEAKYEEAMKFHNNAVSTLHEVYTEFKMIHVFPNFIRVLFARFAFCLSFNLINEASLDIVTAAESLNIYLQNSEIPESLKQSAIKQFCEMSVFLREFSQEVREQIYNNTNKVGEMLRLIVEDRAFGI